MLSRKSLLALFVLPSLVFAKDLPNPPMGGVAHPALNEIHGVVTTLIPQLKPLAPDEIQGEKTYTLADGTHVPTLFYQGTSLSPRPLIIANFGLFTDKGSGALGRFIRNLVLTGKIDADFLVVSSNTSATFFSENGEFGLGGYDEGKILVDFVRQIRGPHFHNSSIELLGISLGGNAVLQALIEEARLGRHDFQSAVIFSGLLNEGESSAALLAAFGHPISSPVGPPLTEGGAILAKSLVLRLKATLKSENEPYKFPIDETGDLFYKNFDTRLARLSKLQSAMESWNPKVSTRSIEEYLATSSDLVAEDLHHSRVPLIVVHAENDPLIPFAQFQEFSKREASNPHVFTLATEQGGHFGFASPYGDDWLNELIKRARQEIRQEN
jgi:predicted alpha/beta-fold hydrolase